MELLSLSQYRSDDQAHHASHMLVKFRSTMPEFRLLRRHLRQLPCEHLVVQDPTGYLPYLFGDAKQQATTKDQRFQMMFQGRQFVYAVRVFESQENLYSAAYRWHRDWAMLLKLYKQ